MLLQHAIACYSNMTISQQDVRSITSDFKLTRCARRHVRLLSHVAITVGSDQPNVNVVAGAGRYRHWYWMRGWSYSIYIGMRSINRYENAGIVNASNLLYLRPRKCYGPDNDQDYSGDWMCSRDNIAFTLTLQDSFACERKLLSYNYTSLN